MDIASVYMSAERNFSASPSTIEKKTDKALSRISHHAQSNTKYYRDLFANLGLVSGLSRISDLAKLPCLEREHVLASASDMMCAAVSTDLTWRKTSGTSGAPLRIPWSREQLNAAIASRLRFSKKMGLRPWDSAAWVHYTGKLESTNADDFYEAYGRRSPSVMWTNPSKFLGCARRIESLERFSPGLIASWPSDLARTGRVFVERRKNIATRIVLAMGEVLTKCRREELGQLWRGEVFEVYGASEFGLLAMECADHHGLHLNSDLFVFEVLNGRGEASSDGRGELVVTNLYNRALPLFRYNTHDLVVTSEGDRCSCGTYFPLVTSISGRFRDGVLRSDGSRVPPGVVMQAVESVIGTIEYQLTQESTGAFTLAVPRGQLGEDAFVHVHSALANLLGSLTLDLVVLCETVGKKQRKVVSKV